MTAERDRLAALLHEEVTVAWSATHFPVMPFPDETYEAAADRLMDAGVGMAAEWYHRGRNRGLSEGLDVERLARALMIDWTPFWDEERLADGETEVNFNRERAAAAIAAAYREDAK